MAEENPPSPEEIDALVVRVAILQRVLQEDCTTEESEGVIRQFGNNFHLLFLARLIRDKKPNAGIIRVYLERAEGLDNWQKFLDENASILTKIDTILEKFQIYKEVIGMYRNIIKLKDFDGADAFGKKIDSDLGIDAIAIPIWRELNALLEQAAEAMRKSGIEPEQFYG